MSVELHVNSVAYGLLYSVASFQTIVDCGYTVELEQIDDQDLTRLPWVGIYLSGIRHEPGPIGGVSWDAVFDWTLIVRDAHAGMQRIDAIDSLYRAVGPVFSAVHCNLTLHGSVDIVDEIVMEPFESEREEENYVQAMEITISARKQLS